MASFTAEQLAGRIPIQLGFTVTDLEQAARFWAEAYGAGPFFVFDKAPISDVRFADGRSATVELGAAVGQWGPVQVELMKWNRVEPGPLAEILTVPGYNHTAYFAADPQTEAQRLDAAGSPLLVSLNFGPVPVHWHDGRATTGTLIEHFPVDDTIVGLFGMVADAAQDWDGTDPVRSAPA